MDSTASPGSSLMLLRGQGARVPVILTFLAPAPSCNQRCPRCLIDLTGEPVHDAVLGPDDYQHFVMRFVEAEIPVKAVSFQGYEVTLPESWVYVERVFRTCQAFGIPRGLITNGMLLHKWASSLRRLEPQRITVSLDGSCGAVNDPIRGLRGAFDATTSSLRKLFRSSPELRDRLSVASTLHGAQNFESLLAMPQLLQELGINLWAVSMETTIRAGRQVPAHSATDAGQWFGALREAAVAAGVQFYVSDELCHFREVRDVAGRTLEQKHIFDPAFLYRVEPSGHVRVGEELLRAWDPQQARRWDPATDDPIEVVGHNAAAKEREIRRTLTADSTFGLDTAF